VVERRGEERVGFGGFSCGCCFLLLVLVRVESVVVEALRDQRAVREAEVDCECDDSRDEAGPEASCEREDVAGGPDEKEWHGDAVGVAIGVVFDKLRDEQEDPGGERDGAQDAAEGFGGGEGGSGVHSHWAAVRRMVSRGWKCCYSRGGVVFIAESCWQKFTAETAQPLAAHATPKRATSKPLNPCLLQLA
jgi:hypothetical protein